MAWKNLKQSCPLLYVSIYSTACLRAGKSNAGKSNTPLRSTQQILKNVYRQGSTLYHPLTRQLPLLNIDSMFRTWTTEINSRRFLRTLSRRRRNALGVDGWGEDGGKEVAIWQNAVSLLSIASKARMGYKKLLFLLPLMLTDITILLCKGKERHKKNFHHRDNIYHKGKKTHL